MEFVPHSYQTQAVEFLKSQPHAALFADPGLGKTGIILSLLKELYFTNRALQPALIIAPKRVAQFVWPTEIKKFHESFGFLRYLILHGPDKEKRLTEPADIYLLNTENIFWVLGQRRFETLIIDESSKFKSVSAKRFRALAKHLKSFKSRYLLTGTPAPKSIMDLFSQQYIIDLGQALGSKITHYRATYFHIHPNKRYVDYTPKKGALEAIQSKIKGTVFRLDQKDHLNLPEIIYNNVCVELPPDARKVYTDFEEQLLAHIEDQPVLLRSAEQLYGVCCQIANGRMYEPKGVVGEATKRVVKIHSEKMRALSELLSELRGKPALIYYHYKHDLDQLLELFGPRTPYIGATSSHNQDILITKWNHRKLAVLLCQPMSMAYGLNLQDGGNDIVWVSPPDNLEIYIQANQRIWRQGVRNAVRVHHLIATDTVDELKLQRLQQRNRNQMRLLDALKEYKNGKNLELSQW
jgi:SNF2 family DNA or RNA helicase